MTEIKIEDIINGSMVVENGNHKWVGTGFFDVAIDAVNENFATQYRNQRINGADYAIAYTNAVVAVLQQSVDFALRKGITEAQIDNTQEDTALKYVQRIKLDKETALLGMDEVIKNANTTPEQAYTPKYEDQP